MRPVIAGGSRKDGLARPDLYQRIGTVGYGLVPEVLSSSLLIAIPAQAAPATVYIYKVYFDTPQAPTAAVTRA
jgi:hypothetical protein